MVGKAKSVSAYGHYKEYSFPNANHENDDYIARCSVTWNGHGATFVEPSGHTLFIPKTACDVFGR
jgi:hypothetical protein